MPNHEVISAFLDNEPFDPQALTEALADPGGRVLLIDSLALRRLAQPDDMFPPAAAVLTRRRQPLRVLAAAAALAIALGGGYVWGERSGSRTGEAAVSSSPPPVTRVVKSETGWQAIPPGGVR